jgi:long-chain acyl-CoA synthetase
MRLVSDEGSEVATGQVGEVAVRSPWLFNGYWNKPDETAGVIKAGWYHTGDLGKRDHEGYLYLVDRKKNVIISGGQNIFPREVEEILYQHAAVAEAAVIGKKDAYWGEAVTAYVVPRPGVAIDVEEVKAHCAGQLARYKLPKSINIVDKLPKNGAGKVLHRVLRDQANAE